MIELKNIQDKRFVLGQYFTHPSICEKIVSRICFEDAVVVEPSFGSGNFIKELVKRDLEIYGIELDEDLYDESLCSGNERMMLENKNFYDFTIDSERKIIFVGNPPYRTPAYSLTTHKDFISRLTKKYNVLGIREEAVFFILHSIDIILSSKRKEGEIHYILPQALLKNNSKFFQRFKEFLKEECEFENIMSIKGKEFENVAQDLICLSLRVGPHKKQTKICVDGVMQDIDEYLCLVEGDVIPFQKIFKRTYLGSVPCESVLMSISGESKAHFRDRLCKIISDDNLDKRKLHNLLQFSGRFHLKIFEKPFEDQAVQDKLSIILSYIENMKEKDGIIEDFKNLSNYKEINGRSDVRYYFRCTRLKEKKNFVYELNPNPCRSFYFTGNPSSSSTDYFGYCEYDINRNVSPGANRTVPVEGIEDNLTDLFKAWWRRHTKEPYSAVFEYIQYVATTDWYKNRKSTHKRFYFSIPVAFVPKDERVPEYEIPSINLAEDLGITPQKTMVQETFVFR